MSTDTSVTTSNRNRVEPTATAYELLEAAQGRSGISLSTPTQQMAWLIDQAEALLKGWAHVITPEDLKRLPDFAFDTLIRAALAVRLSEFFEYLPSGNPARDWVSKNAPPHALGLFFAIYGKAKDAVGTIRATICRLAIESREVPTADWVRGA